MDELDRTALASDAKSTWRKALSSVTGSYRLDTGEIEGFDALLPDRRAAVREALRGWKEEIFDTARGVEPNVNAALRGRTPRTAKIEADIEALDSAFGASRAGRALTVYRGVGDGSHILPSDWRTRDLSGLEWTDEAFTATSASKDFASTYIGGAESGGFGLRIKLAKGSPAIALPDAIGGLDNEGEIILPRGLRFRVIKDNGTDRRSGERWLDVEVVSAARSGKAAAKPNTVNMAEVTSQLEDLRRNPVRGDREKVAAILEPLGKKELDQIILDNNWQNSIRGNLTQKREQIVQNMVGRRLSADAIFATKDMRPSQEQLQAEVDFAKERIRSVYHELRKTSANEWVSLKQLREMLADLPRAQQDIALTLLGREPGVNIIPESNQKTLTGPDRAAAVTIGNQEKHLISIRRSREEDGDQIERHEPADGETSTDDEEARDA
jgi:hypothetical protein